MVDNYIFGYGSLISAQSRAKSRESGSAIPVRVKGIERQGNLCVQEAGITAVGAISNKDGLCNGVVVPVKESELPKFDQRELPYGYSRIQVSRENILPYRTAVPDGVIWAYVANSPGQPSAQVPILQSYVDVILTGCFDFGEAFAKEFVEQTSLWDSPWVNDRKEPRYVRGMVAVPLAEKN